MASERVIANAHGEPRPLSGSAASGAPRGQPVGKIHPQPWMTAPETCALLGALTQQGAQVRFIGGCVRDAVLKRPVRDIDLALPLPPDGVMTTLRQRGI